MEIRLQDVADEEYEWGNYDRTILRTAVSSFDEARFGEVLDKAKKLHNLIDEGVHSLQREKIYTVGLRGDTDESGRIFPIEPVEFLGPYSADEVAGIVAAGGAYRIGEVNSDWEAGIITHPDSGTMFAHNQNHDSSFAGKLDDISFGLSYRQYSVWYYAKSPQVC